MKIKMRRILPGKGICLLILTGILLCLSAAAGAEALQTLPYIQDDADLLTDAEEQALFEDMKPVCEYGIPMFWTTREAGDYESLARNFFHKRLQRKIRHVRTFSYPGFDQSQRIQFL